MDRFFGMMLSSEIEIEREYKDKYGMIVTIQAGENGWSIIWADSSSNYQDFESTAEDNFNTAYNFAIEKIESLTLIDTQKSYCIVE